LSLIIIYEIYWHQLVYLLHYKWIKLIFLMFRRSKCLRRAESPSLGPVMRVSASSSTSSRHLSGRTSQHFSGRTNRCLSGQISRRLSVRTSQRLSDLTSLRLLSGQTSYHLLSGQTSLCLSDQTSHRLAWSWILSWLGWATRLSAGGVLFGCVPVIMMSHCTVSTFTAYTCVLVNISF